MLCHEARETIIIMKRVMQLRHVIFGSASLFALAASSHAQTTIIDENFDSGYNRTSQSIAGGNMAILKSRTATTPTVGVGSLSFSALSSAGANQFFGYYTDPGANVGAVQNGHIVVGVGATLTFNYTFNLSAMPADTSYALRFGVFDDVGTRQTADLTSGGSSAAFNNNPGYALFIPLTSQVGLNNQFDFKYHGPTFNNNIFNSTADFTRIGSLTGGAYTPLASSIDYTLKFSINRQDASTTVLTASILEGATVRNTATVTQTTGTQTSSFDWFGWRVPNETVGGTLTFKDVNATITEAPEPSTFMLMGLGALAALQYRREKN